MVTKRAKRWLGRGTTLAVLLVSFLLLVATWVQGAAIERDWLTVETSLDEGAAVLEEVVGGTALLTDGDALDRPGVWMVQNRDGWLRLGDVVSNDTDGVRREVIESSGSMRPGSGVQFSRLAWGTDAPPVELTDVVVDGPLGEHAAWVTEGDDDTWVILIHGNGADRSEALRLLPAIQEAGYAAIVPTYRNDIGAPQSKGEHHGFGRDEWRDIDSVVDFALAAGARDFVLVGYGSGGSIIGEFLYESHEAERVVGVVLDAPVLSLGITVDEAWAPSQIPGFIVGWAKAMATFRYGVDWAELDHVARAAEWKPPVLILHGRQDDRSPLRSSAEFATTRIDSTLLLTFPEAGYGASWNVDPDRYESAVIGFIDDQAATDSEFE